MMTTTEQPQPQQTETVMLASMIALEPTVKRRTERDVTDLMRELKREPQMTGVERTYRPARSEDTEMLPAEQTKVQIVAKDIVEQAFDKLADLFDVVGTRENGNSLARADIVVGDVAIARDVPVTYMLFLEKQLRDIAKFVSSIPSPDPSEQWSYDATTGVYKTPTRVTTRTKKMPFAFEKAPATDKHAAQVDKEYEDRVVGFWDKISYSGAMAADDVKKLVDRVDALQRAVKTARQKANAIEVPKVKIGRQFMDYLMAP